MEIEQRKFSATGIKLFILENGLEIARAYVYILKNDLHTESFAFLEDVFVQETQQCELSWQ